MSSNGTPTPAPTRNYVDSIVSETRKPFVLRDDTEARHLLAVPHGFEVRVHDAWKLDPARRSGTVKLDTVDSFIEYVNTFRRPESRIYCQADFEKGAVVMVAVLNDHEAGGVGGDGDYRDFRAVYTPALSLEWKLWAAKDREPMAQDDFATFVEANLRDIASVDGLPDGSAMFKMALAIEITKDSRFRSAIRPQSGGVVLEYVDNDDEATTKRMAVYDRFALGIAPFFGGAAYRVDARLRYRLTAGSLRFWYELIRPDLAVADAVKGELERVKQATGLSVLMGRAE